MARLIDVARAAGVSRSTASNVFNNPGIVRPGVRERVEAAARDLGYLGPDPKGRLLRAGKFNALGVLPPGEWSIAESLRNPVFQLLLRGIGEVCDDMGASLMVLSGRTSDRSIKTALVDGFIFSRGEDLAEVGPALLRRLPFVVLDFDAGPDVNSVRVDAQAGCYAAAKHLTDLGHRRFALVSFMRSAGPARIHPAGEERPPQAAGLPSDYEKYLGYTRALAEVGIDIADVPMIQADPNDRDAARVVLDLAPDATAILSMSIMQAIAVVAEAKRRGKAVSRDLSVVGYNDIPAAAAADPPITTVDGNVEAKGRAAAAIVRDGGAPRQDLLAPRLILRGSTGPAPAR